MSRITESRYRAVFTSPFSEDRSYGPDRASMGEALDDRPTRSEESFEALTGIQSREVTAWVDVTLSDIVNTAVDQNKL